MNNLSNFFVSIYNSAYNFNYYFIYNKAFLDVLFALVVINSFVVSNLRLVDVFYTFDFVHSSEVDKVSYNYSYFDKAFVMSYQLEFLFLKGPIVIQVTSRTSILILVERTMARCLPVALN